MIPKKIEENYSNNIYDGKGHITDYGAFVQLTERFRGFGPLNDIS